MRLIDADALMSNAEYKGKYDILTAYDVVAAPTIDAVPVVRCGECRFAEKWYRNKSRCFMWCSDGIDVFNDGYCSYGERREDGEQDAL